MEVVQDATDSATLQEWGANLIHDLMRTVPSNKLENDFISSVGSGFGIMGGYLNYPATPIIDLSTMEVIETNCNVTAETWSDYLSQYLEE